ncbi:hypothetical protein [Sphingomonas trueperi]|jgi:hypothetical protein|uniref:hypothetical protein n=1 Tax=Sphingomonas trueperi TaxID=53317 RepID=UPI000EAC92B6
MSYTPTDLVKAEKNVVLAERHIAAQQEVLAMMRAAGTDTSGAEELLARFEADLGRAERIRDWIASGLGERSSREPQRAAA